MQRVLFRSRKKIQSSTVLQPSFDQEYQLFIYASFLQLIKDELARQYELLEYRRTITADVNNQRLDSEHEALGRKRPGFDKQKRRHFSTRSCKGAIWGKKEDR